MIEFDSTECTLIPGFLMAETQRNVFLFVLLISFNLNCFITSLPWFSLVHNALTNNVIHTAGVLRCISSVTKDVLQKL